MCWMCCTGRENRTKRKLRQCWHLRCAHTCVRVRNSSGRSWSVYWLPLSNSLFSRVQCRRVESWESLHACLPTSLYVELIIWQSTKRVERGRLAVVPSRPGNWCEDVTHQEKGCGVSGMVAFKQPCVDDAGRTDTDLVEHRNLLLTTWSVSKFLKAQMSNLSSLISDSLWVLLLFK